MIQIESILKEIVARCYDNKYNDFEIKFYNYIDKEKHGAYMFEFKLILIFNLYRSSKNIIMVALHETAHAVQHQMTGKSDHDKEFYTILLRLLAEGIRLNLFTMQDFFRINDNTDPLKINQYFGIPRIKTLDRIPLNDQRFIFVKDYDKKYNLKEENYQYNVNLKVWEKETEKKFLDVELLKIKNLDFKVKVTNLWDINTHFMTTIKVKKDNNNNEKLKEYGYTEKNNYFVKHIAATKTRTEIIKLKLKGINAKIE